MCGRYYLEDPAESEAVRAYLEAWRRAHPKVSKRPEVGEIFPTHTVLLLAGARPAPLAARWGLRSAGGRDLINARAETVPEKPTFAPLLPGGRCLFVASAFYEWGHPDARRQLSLFDDPDGEEILRGRKVKYAFSLPGEPLLYMAGLFRPDDGTMRGHDNGFDRRDTGGMPEAVIVTTAANASVRATHDRMPLLLAKDDARAWLREEETARRLLERACSLQPVRRVAEAEDGVS